MHVRAAALKQFSAVPSASGADYAPHMCTRASSRDWFACALVEGRIDRRAVPTWCARQCEQPDHIPGLVAEALHDDFLGFHLARD